MDKNQNDTHLHDVWASAEAYEYYVGRWSRPVARKFLEWLAVPPGSRWLDVGCGAGALTQAILEAAAPQRVIGVDAAQDFIDFARQKITDPRATFQKGDALSLPVETDSLDVAVSGFFLNFMPQPIQAVMEMVRSVQPGGLVAAYVWDYAGKVQFMRHFWNAAAALDPAAAALDEGKRFPSCNPGALVDLFTGAGLRDVEVVPVDIWTDFKDFDDYWSPFLGGQGPAPTYAMSLSEEKRSALRERLRLALPFALDGSIPLMARAWGVRGVR